MQFIEIVDDQPLRNFFDLIHDNSKGVGLWAAALCLAFMRNEVELLLLLHGMNNYDVWRVIERLISTINCAALQRMGAFA